MLSTSCMTVGPDCRFACVQAFRSTRLYRFEFLSAGCFPGLKSGEFLASLCQEFQIRSGSNGDQNPHASTFLWQEDSSFQLMGHIYYLSKMTTWLLDFIFIHFLM